MRLYWYPRTRAVRALWLLEEAGVAYECITIDISSPRAAQDPAFRAASPMGKVPAIEDGPVRIWDSGAICAYVADQYPERGLAPPIGDPDRGRYLMWLMYTNAVIEPVVREKSQKYSVDPIHNGWGSWDLMLETLRKGLEHGPWILGKRFSAADVMLGTACDFLRECKMLGDDPVLFAYADRCAERPAFQRARLFDVGSVSVSRPSG